METSGNIGEFPAWALRDKEPPEEVMEKLVDCLYGLRMKYGLPEVPYWVPFDGPERRDWINYIPFAWAPPITEILLYVGEYVRAAKQRKEFAQDRKRYAPKAELEDIAEDNRNIIEKLQCLSAPAREVLKDAGFDMEQYLTLNNALFRVPWAKLEPPGRGRPNEPEKKRLLEKIVQMLRGHLERIPTEEEVETICESLLGYKSSASVAVSQEYSQNQRPSEVLTWFYKQGIKPDEIPEGTYRWTLFAKACAELYDRPERLRRRAEPMTFEARKKLYRSIWSR